MRKSLIGVLALLLGLSPGLVSPTAGLSAHQVEKSAKPATRAAPAIPPMIRSKLSGRCLDADLTGISHNGTLVQLWTCNGQSQQRWSQGVNSEVLSYASGRCLDADLLTIGANGTRIQLWDCNFENQQKFWYAGDTFRVAYNGKCLDADTWTSNQDGGKVQLWDCNGSIQQEWEIAP
jgi:hypothetical protein